MSRTVSYAKMVNLQNQLKIAKRLNWALTVGLLIVSSVSFTLIEVHARDYRYWVTTYEARHDTERK
jgi:hypothetical protein